MEEIMKLFVWEHLPYYTLGLLGFVAGIFENFTNKKTKKKSFAYFVEEGIYTFIMIAVGITVSISMEYSQSTTKLISILMGIIGPTIIRKVKRQKDTIADSFIDAIKNRFTKSVNVNKQK
jgi:uncharacterized membrane protein YjjP (DUF1212 family)